MSSDKKGIEILARTFFNQLRSGGYTSNQIIALSSELLDLVTSDLKEGDKALPPPQEVGKQEDWRRAL